MREAIGTEVGFPSFPSFFYPEEVSIQPRVRFVRSEFLRGTRDPTIRERLVEGDCVFQSHQGPTLGLHPRSYDEDSRIGQEGGRYRRTRRR